MTDPNAKREKISGMIVEYLEFGSKEGIPVVFLHGNPGTKDDCKGVAEIMAGKGFHCFLIDRPGHGHTQRIPQEMAGSIGTIDIITEFIKKMCKGKCILVGYSIGCFYSLRIALKTPNAVLGLGLIAPFILPRDPAESPSKLPDYADFPVIGNLLAWLAPKLAEEKIRQHIKDCAAPGEVHPTTMDTDLARFNTFASIIAVLRDKNDFLKSFADVSKTMKTITCPTFVIVGDKDAVSQGTLHMEKICQVVPESKREIIRNGCHGLPMHHAAQVADLLSAFFSASQAAKPAPKPN